MTRTKIGITAALRTAAVLAGLLLALAVPTTATAQGDDSPLGETTSGAPEVSHGPRVMAEKDGLCHVGEFCLYYQPDFGLPMIDYATSDPDYFDDRFVNSAFTVAQNSGSFINGHPYYYVVGCTGQSYTGSCGYADPYTYGIGWYGNFAPEFDRLLVSHYFATSGIPV